MTSWIQFAYNSLNCTEFPNFTPEECDNQIAESITMLIDINGYAYFSLAVIPLFPVFLIRFFTSRYQSEYVFAEMRTKVSQKNFESSMSALSLPLLRHLAYRTELRFIHSSLSSMHC